MQPHPSESELDEAMFHVYETAGLFRNAYEDLKAGASNHPTRDHGLTRARLMACLGSLTGATARYRYLQERSDDVSRETKGTVYGDTPPPF